MTVIDDIVRWLRTDSRLHTKQCFDAAASKATTPMVECTCYITQKCKQAEKVQQILAERAGRKVVTARCAACNTLTKFDEIGDSISCGVCLNKYINKIEKSNELQVAISNGFSTALMSAERAINRIKREKDALHDEIEHLEEVAERRNQQLLKKVKGEASTAAEDFESRESDTNRPPWPGEGIDIRKSE